MVHGLVSVIITVYNRLCYLPQAIESVLSQTYPEIEIIIIDDGSEAGSVATKEVLAPYLRPSSSRHSRQITYHYQENQGLGAAVNRGLTLARGEYTHRLDDDDCFLPEKIARSVEVLQANPAAGMAATGYYIIDADGERVDARKPRVCPNPTRLLNTLLGFVSIPSAVMVPAAVHRKVGMYRTDLLGGDYEMWIRIAKEYDVETIDEPLVEYRRHPENVSNGSNQARLENEKLHFTREHLESISIDTLIPNLQSRPHAYALRAAIYLTKDRQHARTTNLARQELETAIKLAPEDTLLHLWRFMLAAHGDDSLQPHAVDESLPVAYQLQARNLARLVTERKRLSSIKMSPLSPEMIAFRQEFTKIRSALIRDTYRQAVRIKSDSDKDFE